MQGFFRKFTHLLKTGDFFALNIAFAAAEIIDHRPETTAAILIELATVNLSWYVISRMMFLYHNTFLREAQEHLGILAKTLAVYLLFIFSLLFLLHGAGPGRGTALLFAVFTTLLMVFCRVVVLLNRKRNRFRINRSVRTVLLGSEALVKDVIRKKQIRSMMGIRGYYTPEDTSGDAENLGNTEMLINDIERGRVDNIIICDHISEDNYYAPVVERADRQMVRIYYLPKFWEARPGVAYRMFGDLPLLKLLPEPLQNHEKQLVKRIFDIGFSLFVIIFIMTWLTPVVALIIMLESRGPVFFSQKRSGLNNVPFRCIKFRSMRVNEASDIMTAKKNDSRVTRFGAFLRKTSIDELPQFFNVLIGNMSVVGPRPHMLSQTAQYKNITRKYMLRHIVKPGITGWAQVTGARGEIFSEKDMQRRIEKDIWYIQNWSFFWI